jgi:rapamycin-insensitive companion of mTOR
MDLFNIELDADTVQAMAESAKSLRVPRPRNAESQPPERVVSMSFRLGRPRRMSESDEDEDESDVDEDDRVVVEIPTISLRPVSVITGFAI